MTTQLPSHLDRIQSPAAGRWAAAAAIAVYFPATCLMHLEFSLWLVRARATAWGPFAFSQLMPVAIALSVALLGYTIWKQLQRSNGARVVGACWASWLACVMLCDRYLTFSLNEYLHYPQYALLAWLVARAIDPQRTGAAVGRVVFWTTLLGAADEWLQYLWVTTSYSNYYDFNDVLVNLLAAVAGVLLYYGGLRERVAYRLPRPSRVESGTAVVLAAVVAASIQLGVLAVRPEGTVPPGGVSRLPDGGLRLWLQRGPDFHGSWQPGPHHGRHYVLPPFEGMAWVLLAGFAFAGFAPGAGAYGGPAGAHRVSRGQLPQGDRRATTE
jgi:hypothetical protein